MRDLRHIHNQPQEPPANWQVKRRGIRTYSPDVVFTQEPPSNREVQVERNLRTYHLEEEPVVGNRRSKRVLTVIVLSSVFGTIFMSILGVFLFVGQGSDSKSNKMQADLNKVPDNPKVEAQERDRNLAKGSEPVAAWDNSAWTPLPSDRNLAIGSEPVVSHREDTLSNLGLDSSYVLKDSRRAPFFMVKSSGYVHMRGCPLLERRSLGELEALSGPPAGGSACHVCQSYSAVNILEAGKDLIKERRYVSKPAIRKAPFYRVKGSREVHTHDCALISRRGRELEALRELPVGGSSCRVCRSYSAGSISRN
ncbi:MAG: hypothetical protein Q6359_02105 [Candidatus Brocadiales bacterium]|nr:hypothetical protein [Candidatus Brocadiales bacterium]